MHPEKFNGGDKAAKEEVVSSEYKEFDSPSYLNEDEVDAAISVERSNPSEKLSNSDRVVLLRDELEERAQEYTYNKDEYFKNVRMVEVPDTTALMSEEALMIALPIWKKERDELLEYVGSSKDVWIGEDGQPKAATDLWRKNRVRKLDAWIKLAEGNCMQSIKEANNKIL